MYKVIIYVAQHTSSAGKASYWERVLYLAGFFLIL